MKLWKIYVEEHIYDDIFNISSYCYVEKPYKNELIEYIKKCLINFNIANDCILDPLFTNGIVYLDYGNVVIKFFRTDIN